MSIRRIKQKDYRQNLSTNSDKKLMYGEIFTPFRLIEPMLEMYPEAVFQDPGARWMDAGAGTGFFSMALYWKLMESLRVVISDDDARHNHIVRNMMHMCELQPDNVSILRKLFGDEANIHEGDFLQHNGEYDHVIGNPPYNSNGMKKVPTNNSREKKADGRTVWISFVRHSLHILRPGGNMLVVVPSLWMRPDRAGAYSMMTSHKLEKLHCLTNTQTNQLFSGEAQTPTSCVLLSKRDNDWTVDLYDNCVSKYVPYTYTFGEALPVFGASVVSKVRPRDAECLAVQKSNMPPKAVSIAAKRDAVHVHPNIRTTVLDGLDARLIIEYSDKPLAFQGKRKVVMAHKMYGFPYVDLTGEFGISNRDNYVICHDDVEVLERISQFLSTKLVMYVFESTRYRMKYLEKEAFWMLPDALTIAGLEVTLDDDSLAELFGLSDEERQAVERLHKKAYTFTFKLPIIL